MMNFGQNQKTYSNKRKCLLDENKLNRPQEFDSFCLIGKSCFE